MFSKNIRKHSIGGFSLLELLVAVLIATILAVLLTPTIKSIIQRGNEANCISNLRQISLGFSLLLQENGNRYPAFASNDTDPTDRGLWVLKLLPYIGVDTTKPVLKMPKVLICRSQPLAKWPTQEDPEQAFCYGYNQYLGNNYNNGSPNIENSFVRLSPLQIGKPSRLILCADTGSSKLQQALPVISYVYNTEKPEANNPIGDLHHGGSNVLFCDGHVEWKSRSDVSTKQGDYSTPYKQLWGMYGKYNDPD